MAGDMVLVRAGDVDLTAAAVTPPRKDLQLLADVPGC